MAAAEINAFADQLYLGVGLHSAQFKDCEAGLLEDLHRLIINAHPFNTAPSVNQQDALSALRQFGKMADHPLSKVDFGGYVVSEVLHFISLSALKCHILYV